MMAELTELRDEQLLRMMQAGNEDRFDAKRLCGLTSASIE